MLKSALDLFGRPIKHSPMKIRNSLFIFSILFFGQLYAVGFVGLIDRQPPSLQLQRLEKTDTYKLTVINQQILWEGELVIPPNKPFCKELEVGFSFCGRLSEDGKALNGYFQSGVIQYFFQLEKDESGKLVGAWQSLVSTEKKQQKSKEASSRLTSYSIPY